MTAFVGKNPDTGGDHALDDGVRSPESKASGIRGDVLGRDKVVPDGEDGSEVQDVASNICQRLDSGAFEAVSRDSITNLLDGIVGDLEFVSILIDELALLDIGRAHGRE